MLTPATFIGIAKVIASAGQPQPAGPGRLPTANVQPVRVMPTMPAVAATGLPPGGTKAPVAASPGTAPTPPRNMPRGSLLDLSV